MLKGWGGGEGNWELGIGEMRRRDRPEKTDVPHPREQSTQQTYSTIVQGQWPQRQWNLEEPRSLSQSVGSQAVGTQGKGTSGHRIYTSSSCPERLQEKLDAGYGKGGWSARQCQKATAILGIGLAYERSWRTNPMSCIRGQADEGSR